MSAPKNSKRFAEMERLMSDYFSCHIAPVMKHTQDYLSKKQADEMRDYSSSFAGMLSFMTNADIPGGDPYATLKATGEWNSKTTEDYIAMCRDRILNDKSMQKDFSVMAMEWRKAVIDEIGRERYDEISKQLGCDLSYAYIDHRVEQQMIDKLVKDRMPKSSADYIIRKAAQTSIFGLANELQKSPLTAEIEARGEAAYKPTGKEKLAGWTIGATADALSMGGAGAWGRLAKFIGIDIAVSAVVDKSNEKARKNTQAMSVEKCISLGVFNSKIDLFATFRKEASKIKPAEDDYIKNINKQLNKKTPVLPMLTMDWKSTATPKWQPTYNFSTEKRDEKYKDVPMIVAPGQEEAYLKSKAESEKTKKSEPSKQETQQTETAPTAQETSTPEQQTTQQDASQQDEQQNIQTNENGWGSLLEAFGLNGISDVGKNLGYVLAMLPDVLVGLFTGDTKAFNKNNTIMPIAAIVAGMFIKNPILKMLLIGMGGANLINKAGHEALDKRQNTGETQQQSAKVQYRSYADEPLNPRITGPVLQGSSLIATIDRVPCTIQLPQSVIDAHLSGALPLNTLANAILAKNDAMRSMVEQNYAQTENETIRRSR